MPGGEALFVDTNVLVHAFTRESPRHAVALATLQAAEGQDAVLWVSRQVIREYVAVLSGPQGFLPARLSGATLRAQAERLERRFRVADEGSDVTRHLLGLIERWDIGGKQVHDANIVATMLAHGIHRLLTENVDDFKRFGELVELVRLPT